MVSAEEGKDALWLRLLILQPSIYAACPTVGLGVSRPLSVFTEPVGSVLLPIHILPEADPKDKNNGRRFLNFIDDPEAPHAPAVQPFELTRQRLALVRTWSQLFMYGLQQPFLVKLWKILKVLEDCFLEA